MSMLITPPGKKAIRINRKRFRKEVDLQCYIYENPEAIPVHEIKEDADLLILERESPTPVGPIDILATDSDGEIYIIETKLYRNPDKRQVLAQVLDYGAALWGLLDDPDEGKAAYKKYRDPEDFYKEACRLYEEWKRSRPKKDIEEEEDVEEEVEKLTFTFEEAEEKAWEQIQDYLQTMNPFEFQTLVADLLEAMGYHVSWVSPPGKDKGIDIIAYTDPLGASTPRIKVQV
jgi:hypothetical protein